jgi:AcrR family transcriptional regulator
MAVPTRKAEQSEATRSSLVRVARKLFASRGYANTSIEEIVRRSRVTRGALYYHFEDKQALFRAVCEELQGELVERIYAVVDPEGRWEKHLELGCEAFLDVCLERDFQRICLLDAPSVLGWEAWHEMDAEYSLGMVSEALEAAMDRDYLERQPIEPLSHVIIGALSEAGLVIARAEEPKKARAEVGATVARLIEGLKPRK